jgi:hypothetical protein
VDAASASRVVIMAARPAFPWRCPQLREETVGKGGMRKKKGDGVASDRRVPRVSDTRARPSWRWIGGGLAGPKGDGGLVGWLRPT